MSAAEMKLAAFEKLAAINEEEALKYILEQISKVSETIQPASAADAFFEEASAKYGDVLKKLAQ